MEGEVAIGVVDGGTEAADGGVLVDVVGGVGGGGAAVDGEGGAGAVTHGIVVVGIALSAAVGGAGDLVGGVVAVGAGGGGAVAEGFGGSSAGGVDGVGVAAGGGAGFFVDAVEELTGVVVGEVFADGVFVGEEVEAPGFVVGVGGEGRWAIAGDVVELGFGGPGVIDRAAAGGVHLETQAIGIVGV